MTVLIVDDSKTMRLIIRELLQEIGITDVHEAADGKEALEKLVNRRFDLILLDIHMPEMDGDELLEALQGSSHTRTPVIVVSSDSDHEVVNRMRGFGVSAYITKPFAKDRLAKVIGAVCSGT